MANARGGVSVRVGVDENLAPELLADFPPEAEIVRIPRAIEEPVEVDFWIVPFIPKIAIASFPASASTITGELVMNFTSPG